MPFNILEASANLGKPEELYEFRVGDDVWRVTSRSRASDFLGYEWRPLPGLTRTRFKQASGGGDDSIQLNVPMDFAIAKMFKFGPPALPVSLVVYRHHIGDGNSYGQSWAGRIRGCEWAQGAVAVLHADGANSVLRRHTLRLSFDHRCPHMLYDPGCKLDPENFKIVGSVGAVTKNTIISAAFATKPNDWLTLGFVKYSGYRFMISSHSADTITLFTPTNLTKLPQAVQCEAYAGCDHLLDTCWGKFNNGLNSEANPWMPNRNPFLKGL